MKDLLTYIYEGTYAQDSIEYDKPKKGMECYIFYTDSKNKNNIIDIEKSEIQKTFAKELGRYHGDYHKWVYVNDIRFERKDWSLNGKGAGDDTRNGDELFNDNTFNGVKDDQKYKEKDDHIPRYVAYGNFLNKIKNLLKSSNKINNFTFDKNIKFD